ncbi:hypothetical protein X924_03220 [Petrotoga sp. 9PWA.NaAc.5.4]|nr:hypothetical protein X924_03220 [Petrotoga sp. 9PWA.NaAc.5.4]
MAKTRGILFASKYEVSNTFLCSLFNHYFMAIGIVMTVFLVWLCSLFPIFNFNSMLIFLLFY